MFKNSIALILALMLIPLAAALTISDVSSEILIPGQEGRLDVTIKNTLGKDVKDVSFALDFTGIPLAPVDSSEASVDELDKGDKESFSFLIRADTNAKVGDYKIPYVITYGNSSTMKKGTLSIRVSADPVLSYSLTLAEPIIGTKTKATFKIINKGLGEARFVSIHFSGVGLTILSDKEIYVGSVDSDDFETISLDVIPSRKSATLTAVVEYQDDDAKSVTRTLDLPAQAYTFDEAVAKGIAQKSNAPVIIGIIGILVICWLIYRFIAKRRRMRLAAHARGI
jgi:hypothetical protein